MTNKEVIISALQNKGFIELTEFIEKVLEYFSGKCPPRTVEELIECEKRGDSLCCGNCAGCYAMWLMKDDLKKYVFKENENEIIRN